MDWALFFSRSYPSSLIFTPWQSKSLQGEKRSPGFPKLSPKPYGQCLLTEIEKGILNMISPTEASNSLKFHLNSNSSDINCTGYVPQTSLFQYLVLLTEIWFVNSLWVFSWRLDRLLTAEIHLLSPFLNGLPRLCLIISSLLVSFPIGYFPKRWVFRSCLYIIFFAM